MSALAHASVEALSEGGALAARLDGFVVRPAQLRLTAAVAEAKAMRIDSHAASKITPFCSSSPYHLVENPPQMVTKRDSLNEYTTKITSGRYRKAKPNTSMNFKNHDNFCLCMAGISFDFAGFVAVEQGNGEHQQNHHHHRHGRG